MGEARRQRVMELCDCSGGWDVLYLVVCSPKEKERLIVVYITILA